MAASQALYGQNDDDFWTSDDEEISEPDGTEGDLTEEDVQATDSNDAAASGGEHKEVATQQYLPPAYMNYLAAEDITASPNFVSGPSPIPSSAVVAPKPSMIRKSWVVVDDNPVDDFQTAVPNPALRFPFELDPFQKRAIKHVHHREHTFVAAHTSAGKTVVAEYAIAVAAQRGRRAIYTSPIKALSNQKFREFKQKFDSVGIITGDVSLNPDAQCLIATTEILRAMLYRGDSILNQLDVVIFDEVHYVNDVERGVVWEEVIIMLARDVCLVMLSATVPNFREFADWIGRTKRREVFAIATTRRPTPLKHFLWANDKEFLIMDQSRFRVEAFNELYKNRREVAKTVAAAPSKTPSRGGRGGKTGPNKQQRLTGRGGQQLSGSGGGGFARQSGGAKTKTDSQRLQALIRRLEQESQLPVVVFCFSRKRCEGFPSAMGRLDLLHQQDERSRVHVFIKESFSALPEADRRLPQVIQVTQFLSRGIGVHHGGLLPIVKEAVEILFARGLVKVLFATETFAMGVNMPARSVVFASVEKHDGQRMRMLTSSEYTQMAGRAGRRGLDTFGSVYILCQSDDPPDQKDLTEMMLEKANPLQSRFRLTYAMLLQLASQQSLRIEDMMSLSFREHSRAQRAPTLKRDHARVLHELDAIPPIECIYGNPDAIVSYAETEFCSRSLAHQLHQSLWKYQYALCNTPQAQGGTGVLFASPAGGSSAPFCRGRVVVVHSTPKLTCSTVAVILGLERAIPLSSASRFTQKIETPRFRVLALRQRCHSTQGSQSVPELSETIQSMLEALRNPFQPSRKTNHSSTIQVMLSGSLYGAEMGSFEPGAASEYEIIRAVPLDYFGVVTSHVLSVPSLTEEAWTTCFEGTDEAAVQLVAKALNTLNIGCKGQWTPLALSKNLRSVEIEFVETLLAQKDTLEKLNNSICHNCQLKEHHFTLVERRNACKALQKDIETLLRVDSLHLYDEMRLRYQFLRKRQYIDVQGCITLKGQVAAALSTNDDITITEALLSNVFRGKDPEEAAALLSCFVFPDKVQEVPRGPTEGIAEGRDQIEALHHAIENEMKALRIMVVHEEWWRLCNFGLSAIVYRWANGEGFATIMESTDIQEGTIVRAILRLDELVRKIRSVAKTLLDDSALEALMEETSNRIRRDVVFAISLYLK